jgi:hypothetical protein
VVIPKEKQSQLQILFTLSGPPLLLLAAMASSQVRRHPCPRLPTITPILSAYILSWDLSPDKIN